MAAKASRSRSEETDPRPRVVVVGAGFGGLAAARALAGSPARLTVVDRCNHHLFQPLLYQVATAGLSPADIAEPIRHILSRQANATVLLDRVTAVDTRRREVALVERRIGYDYLVLATGARHHYFGHDWERVAPGLKTIEDATDIRARVLLAFERAENAADAAARERLLNIVIVGGGPTGVEMAGALAELAKRALADDFRIIDPRAARIVLLEAGPRILATFTESLSAYAARALDRLGVDVRTDAMVEAVDDDGVVVSGQRIPTRTVIWAAGVRASPAGAWLGAETDPQGRVQVAGDLSVPGMPNVFVIGDTARALDDKGGPLPGRPTPGPFRYRDVGNWATIGRSSAVVEFGKVRLKGLFAWLLWGAAHIFLLIGFRNKVVVMLEWLWNYVTFKRGMRLITGHRE